MFSSCLLLDYYLLSGVDPGFFSGGGAPLRNGVTDWFTR